MRPIVRSVTTALVVLPTWMAVPAPGQAATTPTSCRTSLTSADRGTLLRAADTSTLHTVQDMRSRLTSVNQVLAARGTPAAPSLWSTW